MAKEKAKAKATAKEKEWKDGWPEKRGTYHCKVDGQEMALTHLHSQRTTLVEHDKRLRRSRMQNSVE